MDLFAYLGKGNCSHSDESLERFEENIFLCGETTNQPSKELKFF